MTIIPHGQMNPPAGLVITKQSILDDLLVIDGFASEEECDFMVKTHNHLMPQHTLQVSSDNRLDFNPERMHPEIMRMAKNILDRTIEIINSHYQNTHVHTDMAGLFARIPGNICDLHADNLRLHCPEHGSNQEMLRRMNCRCPDAQYLPNHTAYREFTGLLYLDSNHKGGDIVFQDELYGETYREQIEAIRGRLVLSPNNQYYYHETTQVTEGIRYSMNMWFTSDPSITPLYF